MNRTILFAIFGAGLTGCISQPGSLANADVASPLATGAPKGAQVINASRCEQLGQQFAAFANVPTGLGLKVEAVAAGPQPARPQWRPAGLAQGPVLPEHCLVSGAMEKRMGTDGKPYETRFELRLPSAWNGRLLYQGGGGNDGIVNIATGRNSGSLGDYGSALSRGYAAVTTDAGHQGTSPEFGADHQARIDKAYAAHERVARTSKALIAGYYGQSVGRSYFLGCSGGGRQGMMFAQRYPEYFDGVISVAPAMSVASKATAAAAYDTQLFTAIAPKDAQGQPILSKAFSPSDMKLIADGIVQSCDAQDGLKDGMVNNVKACKFRPRTLECAGAKNDSCLSAPQVTALMQAFEGPKNAAGEPIYVGQPWDPGVAAPGWRAWKLGTSETERPNANNVTLMGGALGMVFHTPFDANVNTLNFDIKKDFGKLEVFSREYDTFRDDSMQAYFKRGGKFMIVHGMADGIFSANESIDYYERLSAKHGGMAAAQAKARLFLVPGMNHCSSGPSTDEMDAIAAMQDWVEKGQAPAQLLAKALPNSPQFANRSRPLCPYPSYARYKGQGDTESAASFSCVAE